MSILKLGIWFLLAAAAYYALFEIWVPIRKKGKLWHSLVGIAVEFVLAVVCAYFAITFPHVMPRPIYCGLAVVYVVLLADCIALLVFYIVKKLKKNKIQYLARLLVGIGITFALLGAMVLNAQIVTPNYITYSSDKLKKDHKIVYLADMHYGNTQTTDSVIKTLKRIKREEPDLILLGGDITDEFTDASDMEYIYSLIGQLDAPTYFVYGNHDRQEHGVEVGGRTYTDEQLEQALKENKIHVLKDKFVVLDDIVILGRESFESEERLPVKELKPRPKGKYVINLDHTPLEYEDIKETGADLQLSGHIHAGQLFPLRFLYSFGIENICGSYRSGDTDIYVTSGFSGWAFPLRSAAHCNYEVITLKKK